MRYKAFDSQSFKEYLCNNGVDPVLKAYSYLPTMVDLWIQGIRGMKIYEETAKVHESTADRVERNCRYALRQLEYYDLNLQCRGVLSFVALCAEGMVNLDEAI